MFDGRLVFWFWDEESTTSSWKFYSEGYYCKKWVGDTTGNRGILFGSVKTLHFTDSVIDHTVGAH